MALSRRVGLSRMALLGSWCYLLMGGFSVLLVVVFARERQAYRLVRGEWSLVFQLAAGFALALVLVALSRLLTRGFTPARRLESALAELVGPLSGREILLLAAFSGLAEELFFRVALLELLGPYWSTLIFAVLHCGPGRVFLLWTLLAGAIGALLALLTLQGSGLLTLVLIHSGLNLINLQHLSKIASARLFEKAGESAAAGEPANAGEASGSHSSG